MLLWKIYSVNKDMVPKKGWDMISELPLRDLKAEIKKKKENFRGFRHIVKSKLLYRTGRES